MAPSRTLPDPAACEASAVLPSLVPFEELDVTNPAPKPATAYALSDNGTIVDAQSNDAQVIVRSDVPIRAPRPVRAWAGIMPDELAEIGGQFLLGYDSAPSKPFQPDAVQYSAPAVEWVWTSVSGWNLKTSSNPSDWPWPNFDELADQQILERQAFEAQLQGSLSSLDLPNTFTGDVPAYPYAVARVARINTFRGVQDKLQSVVASTEDASSVVDDIARWAYWLDDDHKPLQLERLRNECRILARVIWGPERKLRPSTGAFTNPPSARNAAEEDECRQNKEAAYLLVDLWVKLYENLLIDRETLDYSCILLAAGRNDDRLSILKRILTIVLEFGKGLTHCREFVGIEESRPLPLVHTILTFS